MAEVQGSFFLKFYREMLYLMLYIDSPTKNGQSGLWAQLSGAELVVIEGVLGKLGFSGPGAQLSFKKKSGQLGLICL